MSRKRYASPSAAAIEPITREEAARRGYARYFTGEPCKRNHIAMRYVCNTGCVECMRGPPIATPRSVQPPPIELPRLLPATEWPALFAYLKHCATHYCGNLSPSRPVDTAGNAGQSATSAATKS